MARFQRKSRNAEAEAPKAEAPRVALARSCVLPRVLDYAASSCMKEEAQRISRRCGRTQLGLTSKLTFVFPPYIFF